MRVKDREKNRTVNLLKWKLPLMLAMAVLFFSFGTIQTIALTIDWVTVGDPGNAADTEVMLSDGTTGYGSVDYLYKIGKYEITNSQYCEFLNAVASTDTHGLYNENMGNDVGGIVRSGDAGSYVYTLKNNDSQLGVRPVNFVSWNDSLRFANWMHNGQPTGEQNDSTTEDGAYDMDGSQTRKPGAKFFLPNEDEWYKAAYYKGGSIDAGYWDYATQSDIPDSPDNNHFDFDSGNSANYYDGDFAIGPPYFTNPVGAYDESSSYYGTFDQNGNIAEWNETILGIDDLYRGFRGGAWTMGAGEIPMRSGSRPLTFESTFESPGSGFRLASSTPEPASVLLLGFGILGLVGFGLTRKES